MGPPIQTLQDEFRSRWSGPRHHKGASTDRWQATSDRGWRKLDLGPGPRFEAQLVWPRGIG